LRFAADFFRAAGLRFAADFLAAGLRLAAVFFRAVDFFAAGRLRAADFFLAALFLLAAAMLPPSLLYVGSSLWALRRHALEAPAFPFAHAAPNAVALIAAERVVEAFDANGTLAADPLSLPR